MASEEFMSAKVRIDAETSQAAKDIAALRKELDATGASLNQTRDSTADAAKAADFTKAAESIGAVNQNTSDLASLLKGLTALQAPVAVAQEFFQLGVQIEAAAEKLLGIKDAVAEAFAAIASEGKSPLSRLTSDLAAAQKDLIDGGYLDNAKRIGMKFVDAVTGGDTEAAYDEGKMKRIKDIRIRIARKQHEELDEQIEKNRIATLEGVERLEAEKALAIKKAQKDLLATPGVDGTEYLDSIRSKYDKIIDKAQQKELADIRERSRAYDDLIRKREMKEKEANERIAKHAAETTARAFADIASQYNQMFDIKKMTMTLEALNANMKALTLKRQGN